MANIYFAFYSSIIFLFIALLIAAYVIYKFYWKNKKVIDHNSFLELVSVASPDYIYVYDLINDRYNYSNKPLPNILGFEKSVYTNMADFLSKYLHPDDFWKLKDFKEKINKLQKNELLSLEFRMKHKDGKYVTISSHIVVFSRNGDDEVHQILGAIRDVTKDRHNERMLEEFLREAQSMNEELTAREEELRSNLEKTIGLNQKLLESEFRFKEAQKLTLIGSWEFDLTTERMTWSDQLYLNFGFSPGEITPSFKSFLRIVHPEDLERIKTRGRIKQNDLSSLEFRIIRQDSQVLTMQSNIEPVKDENGWVYKLVGAVQDITERRKTDQHIHELLMKSQKLNDDLKMSEENLRETLKSTLSLNEQLAQKEAWLAETQRIARLGIWEYIPADQTITWTDEVYRLFGVEDKSRRLTLFDFSSKIHPEDKDKIRSGAKRAIEEGVPYEMELRMIQVDGSISWMYTVGNPVLNEEGQVIKLVGFAQDINERKKAEIALVESEKFFKALIQNSSDYVQTIDINAKIVYQSPTMYRLTGYEPSERQGRSIFELIHPGDAQMIKELREEILSNPLESKTIELRIIHKSKSVVWLEVTVSNLLSQPGVNALVVNARDITERKDAEERLKQQNFELKKINAELDGFVYRASHDLRAPLSSILGLISISKEEDDISKKDEYLGMMEKSVLKLDLFIRNIIDYSRNSRLQISVSPIDFNDLINEIFEEYKYMEGSDTIEQKVFIDRSADFYSDLFRLKVILSNIISNAIRYSNPRGQSFIHIFIKITKENTFIEIKDNGRGIGEESVGRIFEMFYRASEQNVGSGLGLYIVKEVIQGLQGTIEVQSTLGEGTIFTVVLPNMK